MSELNIKIRKLQDNGSTFRATPESLYMGGVGSAKVDTLCFDVPEEWKGCAITLHVQRLSGTLPDPQLLDEKNRAVVDQRWTKEKQGLWMLMAVGADGYTAMTKPGRYTCYETIDRDRTTETITPSVYEQFVALVKKETAEANRAAKNAAASAEIAKNFESTITATGEQVQREITATADQTKQAIDEKAKAALASIPEDYTELSESVGQLKEDIVNYSEIYFDDSVLTLDGKYILQSGYTGSVSSYHASEHIAVPSIKSLVIISASSNSGCAIAFYDKSRIFISGISLDLRVVKPTEFDVPMGTRSIRFSNSKDIDFKVVFKVKEYTNGLLESIGDINDKTDEAFNHSSNNIAFMLKNAVKPINIKLIGDSITAGVGGSGYKTDGDNIIGIYNRNPNGYCWAKILKDTLEKKYNCYVTNNGIAGIGSDFIVKHISTLIEDTDDIVICMVGTNDRNKNVEDILSNLQSIHDYCKVRGIKFIPMASIPALVENETQMTLHMEDINFLISVFSKKNKLCYINLFTEFYNYCIYRNESLSTYMADNLHPNDKGYYVLYRIITNALGIVAKIKDATW